MRKNRKLAKQAAAIAMLSTIVVSAMPFNTFAYEEYKVNDDFNKATEESQDFSTWRESTWWGTDGIGENAGTDSIALTPGKDESGLNFAWYSETKGMPAVMVWKEGNKADAKIFTGNASEISASNWQGKQYTASNKVSIENYFESGTKYQYQYTDNYAENGNTEWSDTYNYSTGSTDEFSVILTGDPQIGASSIGDGSYGLGQASDLTAKDESVARDTYNWNKTMEAAMKVSPDAAFLLSAGDQINNTTVDENGAKTRESEYAGYLYPSVFRSLPIAATIGNHDTPGADYTNHFNNPNSSDNLGATEAGSDFYFSYGDVLFISLNSNNRNQEEHRSLMNKAVASHPDAAWKIVIFHSDIYGSGSMHADLDATTNRVIFAPLMDEFDIDVCLTGHDHTYSRSYQMFDGNAVQYENDSNAVTNPEGTVYLTTGSGSGSKYYNLLNYTPYYIAERTNAMLPSFSTIDFTDGSLTVKTYDYNGNKYADDYTIYKTSDGMSVDEVIADAEQKLEDTSVEYTEESKNALKTSLDKLKALKTEYTTAKDPMVEMLTSTYGTKDDLSPYAGYIMNPEYLDDASKMMLSPTIAMGRLKKGVSTLLDKTIYSQISDGKEIQDAVLPYITAEAIESAKKDVVNAIAGMTIKDTSDKNTEVDITDEKAPATGDNMNAGVFMWIALACVCVIVISRKKNDILCRM